MCTKELYFYGETFTMPFFFTLSLSCVARVEWVRQEEVYNNFDAQLFLPLAINDEIAGWEAIKKLILNKPKSYKLRNEFSL